MTIPVPAATTRVADRSSVTVAELMLMLDDLQAATGFVQRQMALQGNREESCGYNDLTGRYMEAVKDLDSALVALNRARQHVSPDYKLYHSK